MITVSEYARKKVGVFGLGKAGAATIASLLAVGAEVFGWDDDPKAGDRCLVSGVREEKNNLTPDTCHLTPIAEWPWNELAAVILSPGVPLTHPKPHEVVMLAKNANVPVIGDIELLYRAQPEAKYIGITGTNGKSTTTTLIGHILKEAGLKVEVGGNLGTPVLELKPLGKDGIYVIELSSYQLDLVQTTRFNVAVLLNITPDHLDRHGDMEGYIKAKMHLFERQQAGDTAVIAVDDTYTMSITKELSAKNNVQEAESRWQQDVVRVVPVSGSAAASLGVYAERGKIIAAFDEGIFDISNIPTLTGRHNWQNAVAAYAAARACGVAPDVIYKAMQSFSGLRHRLQLAATINGVRFINDSKATNADAASNALAPYENIYWILGGKAKAGGIESLTKYFPKIAHAFLIGAAEDEFARTLEGRVNYTRSHTLQKAVVLAAAMAFKENKKDAVVLLSPACASFDQFKNFEERGDVFCELVDALKMEQRHAS